MRKGIVYFFLIILPVLVSGCVCIPHKVTFFAIEAPTASNKITCYTPAFPPLLAIELSFGEVRLQMNNKIDRVQIVICVPEGNTLSIDPFGINLLSEDKAYLEKLEIVSMRIIDHTGKRYITSEGLVRIDGATKRILGCEGYRRLELKLEFKNNRPAIHYVEFPPLWINGTKVIVPLVKFTKKTVMSC